MVFAIVRRTFGVQSLPQDYLIGSQVNLASVIVWIIREQRLHKVDKEEVELNIKLDGRPFWGKNILAIVGLNYIFIIIDITVFLHSICICLRVLVRGVANKHTAINFNISRQGPGDDWCSANW